MGTGACHCLKLIPGVLRDLPDPIADYKGMTRYRHTLVEWLSQFDPQKMPIW